MSSNQAAYLQQLQRNKMMAAEAAAVLNPLAAAFPGLAATSSLDKNGKNLKIDYGY